MYNSCINAFWNTSKINRQGAGSIEATVHKTKIIVSKAVIREVLRLGDQPHHPTLYDQSRVQAALRRMSYEGGYPTVLKKLFPPYWRLLVHFFFQCISENKGGWDQLNKTQTSAIVALVNGWDYNFSAFIFDNMKKMLDDPKKKIFTLYPRFIQMILDDQYPTLFKGPNFINLKPMGPGCFENACRNKRAKHHNFEARFPLEKHGRFADVLQGAPAAPAPPVIPVAPVPPQINAQIAEEHNVQLMQQVQQADDDDDEVLLVDSGSETDWSEETDSESEVEMVMSDKEEDAVRQPVPITSENLAALLQSLQSGDGIPPSVSTTETRETTTDVTEESAQKKQRTDTTPDDTSTAPDSTPIIDPQLDPPTTDTSKKTNLEDTDLYDFNLILKPPPRSQAVQVVVFILKQKVLVVPIQLSKVKQHFDIRAKRDKSWRATVIVMKMNMRRD
ncbi:hypothetical protein Hdeb2414_s0004g00137351 [Helianthus debilis subsp. tardiflorus]